MELGKNVKIGFIILLVLIVSGVVNLPSVIAGTPDEAPVDITTATNLVDLGTTRTLYTVANAHLDTQWNWTIQTTINSYINKTVDQNVTLFTQYPNYNFNFEGAFRYALIKEYYPDKYNTMKNYIAQNRWFVAGSSWDAGDVNVPSPEGVFRNILYGNGYFKREFGKSSVDIFLPDCFGFGYALPSIASHAGLKGFSTQKLSWGSAHGVPFDIGRWIGPDGAYIGAALKTGNYTTSFSGDLSNNSTYLNAINNEYAAGGIYAHMEYHGTGDTGGAPSSGSASSVNTSVNGSGPVDVLSASTDQLFRDITPSQLLGLPSYNGELVMTTHGVGAYTSRTINKRWNRKNELLADATERTSVMANWLGGAGYPLQRLTDAWQRFVWHQFHDDLPGTSVYTAYGFTHNDYVISLNQFAGELSNGVGAIARAMDTQASGIPVVVYNPLALARKDVVEAQVYFPGGAPAFVRVYDNGAEVASQKGTVNGNWVTVIFLADMPSLGYKTFDVQAASSASTIATGLSVTSTTLSSNRYTVTVNSSGDISSIIDKANGNRQLLAGASRLQMQNDDSPSWPSWEILWNAVNSTPREYVSGSVSISILESGPARVALRVTRTQAGSTFTQIIRLNAGGDADRVEVDNNVNWQSLNTLLKATFSMGVNNANATYDLGLGTIQRGNNTSSLYEVPAQQWADITDSGGAYGVSIMNDSKYGWDKPNNTTLRLTLIHTPNNEYGSNGQRRQDLGRNLFQYAIYGHAGSWKTGGTVAQAARLNQPLIAFQTNSHSGALGKSYSFMSISSPQVLVKAVKLAESGNGEVIVRVQETQGSAASNVQLTVGSGIASAREVNAQEDSVGGATVSGGKLQFNIGAYQPKTFALTLSAPPTTVSAPSSTAVALSYNKDVVSPDSARNNGNFDGTNAIPAELFPSTIRAEGITFSMGPTGSGQNNALTASGQSITLNASGASRLYILAGSSSGDITANFTVNGTPTSLIIRDMKANVGAWDLQSTTGSVSTPNIKRTTVAWVGTHLHTSTANTAYKFANLFKYRIDLPAGVSNPVLVLPSNSNIHIFAMTLSNNTNDNTFPAGFLYDSTDATPPTPPLPVGPTPTPTATPTGPTPTPTATSTPSSNLALNKPATADSSCNTNEGPAKAVNGSWTGGNSDKWCSAGATKWLRIDLGASYSIASFTVRHAGAGGESTTYNTLAFNIQLSSDGTNWGSAVVNVTNNTANVTTHNITAATARYVRLNVVTGAQSGANTARIYELEVYGSTGPTPTPTRTPTPTATGTAVTPTPGGDTTDPQNGTITARGENGTNEGMAKAFDNLTSTKWLDFSPDANRASWIQYMYPGAETHIVTQYTVTSANDHAERDPYNWRLYGIDAGGNAILLDTRTAQTFSGRFVKNSYTITNSTAYRGYRLQIDSVLTPSTANSVQLSEIEFIGN